MKIQHILLGALAILSTLCCSCSKWTEPESVKLHYVTLQEKNPELYEAYYQSLRDYRLDEHKTVIAKFCNVATTPSGRAEHLGCLPDSVDYIILKNPDALSDVVISEMAEARSLKGQKILYEISYNDLAKEYKAEQEAYAEYLAAWNAENPEPAEGVEPDTLISQVNFIGAKVKEQIALFDKYGYDGINVVYNGANPLSLRDKSGLYELQRAFLEPLESWNLANESALVFFEGTPHYLLSKTEDEAYVLNPSDFVNNAKYILIPALSASTGSALSLPIEFAASFDNIPTDRFIICTTALSLSDPNATDGLFNEGGFDRAIVGAASWVANKNIEYGKCGISIDNAQNDYFDPRMVYRYIRSAIAIMNPSPLAY